MPNPTALTQRLPRRDASINWHTPHNPTQHTDASLPTLHNFFSQHFLPSNTVINYHHPSSSHHSSFLLYPFHVTDDPIEFQIFQIFPTTVVLRWPFRLLHPIHVSVHFYFLTFNRQFPLLSLTRPGFKKFHPSYLVVFFSFYFSYFTLKLDQFDPFNLGYPTFHHLFHCARRCVRGCLPNF